MQRALLPWGTGSQLAAAGAGLLVSGRGCITYSTAWETTGSAAAAFTLYDGASANGQVLTTYNLAESQSTSEAFVHHALPFSEGLYVDTTSGSVEGSLTVWLDHSCLWWLVLPIEAAKLEAASVVAQMMAAGGQ